MSSEAQLNARIGRLEKKLNDLIEILQRDGLEGLGLHMKARGHN